MKKQPPRIRRIYTGDNLPILRSMNSDTADLIYLDPPFNSGKQWSNPIKAKGKTALASFKDTWDLDDDHADHMYQMRRDCPQAADAIDVMGDINGVSWTAYLIYMGARLLEMRRILKPTGSIYYHCDPVMSHGVKILMDAIFGAPQFLNDTVWRYDGPQSPSKKKFATKHDNILRYAKNAGKVFVSYEDLFDFSEVGEAELKARYKKDEWGYFYDLPPGSYTEESIRELEAEGRVRRTKNGKVRVKYYLVKKGGKYYRRKKIPSVWSDIPSLGQQSSKQKTGYPTQKPLALMERIIKTSSNEGDLVLDPFCGCATTCIAAEKLKRNWIGIDLSEEAAPLVVDRLRKDVESPLADPDAAVEHLRKLPKRNDLERTDNQTIKPRLYKQQNHLCNGCQEKFELRNLEIDHVIDRNRGGQDEDVNLQLLCGACNREKGNRGMQYLQRKISDRMAREHRQKMELLRLKRLTLSDQQGKRD